MDEELFDVLDEHGNRTGQSKLRSLVHRDGDWHKAAHIWIINDRHEILLQRRSANKDSHPNMLDISCAGHLSAGDSSIDGALRELQEELGLVVNAEDLHFIKTFKHSSRYGDNFLNNEFDDMYILKTDKTTKDMTIQEDEVAEIFFVPFTQFKQMVADRAPDLLRHDDEFEILFELFNHI